MAGIRRSARVVDVLAACGHKVGVRIPPGELGIRGRQYIAEAQSKPCYQCRSEAMQAPLESKKLQRWLEMAARAKGAPVPPPGVAKEPWIMTKTEWYGFLRTPKARQVTTTWGTSHYNIVRDALAEGKPVPPEVLKDYLDLVAELAITEGNPLRKFCCRQCGECAPPELLEEGRFPDRIAWLRHHYKAKHPSMWGSTKERE